MKNEIYERIVNDWQKKPMKSVSDIDTALDSPFLGRKSFINSTQIVYNR